LRFGGQVFKNVAGFDAFRLMAGALGQLGVILDVSLRVTPRPPYEAAIALELAPEPARAWLADVLRRPCPISGGSPDRQPPPLRRRLSGGEAGVAAALAQFGGEPEPLAFWDDLRRRTHPMFTADAPLWRLSLPRTGPAPDVGDVIAWDWAGAQRWVRSDRPAE